MKISVDWEFNTLGIYNFNNKFSYKPLFDFIKKNHNKLPGDIVEAGVFKGSTLLSIALFLKKLKSNKKVYGFDTFSGFPKVNNSKYDNINEFQKLLSKKEITKNHFRDVQKLIQIKNIFSKKKINYSNISSSNNFSNTSINELKKKIKILKLKNVILKKGPFIKTMNSKNKPNKIMAAFIDCDLYDSYLQSLNFIWPKLILGGIIQVDEYYSLKFPGARIACNEFLRDKKFSKIKYKNKNDNFERWILKKLG